MDCGVPTRSKDDSFGRAAFACDGGGEDGCYVHFPTHFLNMKVTFGLILSRFS